MTPGITAPQHISTPLALIAGAARVLQLRQVARRDRRAGQLP
jgi:hypothetical protein